MFVVGFEPHVFWTRRLREGMMGGQREVNGMEPMPYLRILVGWNARRKRDASPELAALTRTLARIGLPRLVYMDPTLNV